MKSKVKQVYDVVLVLSQLATPKFNLGPLTVHDEAASDAVAPK